MFVDQGKRQDEWTDDGNGTSENRAAAILPVSWPFSIAFPASRRRRELAMTNTGRKATATVVRL